jgi:hypothetical protein
VDHPARAHTDTAVYDGKYASCHGSNRKGSPAAPSLEGIAMRRTRDEPVAIIRDGTGRMPGFPDLGRRNINDVVDLPLTGKDKASDPAVTNDPTWLKYRNDGYTLRRDPDGYPPITPPASNTWSSFAAEKRTAPTSAARLSRSPCPTEKTGNPFFLVFSLYCFSSRFPEASHA